MTLAWAAHCHCQRESKRCNRVWQDLGNFTQDRLGTWLGERTQTEMWSYKGGLGRGILRREGLKLRSMLGIRPTGLPLPEETGKPQNMEDRWLHRPPQQGPVTSSIQGPSRFLSSCPGGAPRGPGSSLGFWVPPRFRAQGLHRQTLGAGVQAEGLL